MALKMRFESRHLDSYEMVGLRCCAAPNQTKTLDTPYFLLHTLNSTKTVLPPKQRQPTRTKLTKTKFKSSTRAAGHSFGGVACAGAVVLIASSAAAQILFEADAASGNIYEFTPGGTQSTFASGVADLGYLAFNSAGDLFIANFFGNSITKITPGGVQSTFASGLNGPRSLAFNSAGDLFVGDVFSGNIYKLTPGGVRSTFASAGGAVGLAFNSAGDLFVGEAGPNSSSIIKVTPGGVQSTFVSINRYDVNTLAFNSAGDLFASIVPAPENYGYNGSIIEITPGGGVSTFASGLDSPVGIAFQGVTLPVPEPSVLGLLAVGATALLIHRRNLVA
jgi:hypothetical protein